jgi:hypothetical protein
MSIAAFGVAKEIQVKNSAPAGGNGRSNKTV